MAYGDFKDLNRSTFADKVLFNEGFNIAKDPKYGGYNRGLASFASKLFGKETSGSGIKN